MTVWPATIDSIIQQFQLESLPVEGGWFRNYYRSREDVGFNGHSRSLGGAILFLVTQSAFSALHRIRQDEIFHFYAGDSVEQISIQQGGRLASTRLGNRDLSLETPVSIVPCHSIDPKLPK